MSTSRSRPVANPKAPIPSKSGKKKKDEELADEEQAHGEKDIENMPPNPYEQLKDVWNISSASSQRAKIAELFGLQDAPGISFEALELSDTIDLFAFTTNLGLTANQTRVVHQFVSRLRSDVRANPGLTLADAFGPFKSELIAHSIHAPVPAPAPAPASAASSNSSSASASSSSLFAASSSSLNSVGLAAKTGAGSSSPLIQATSRLASSSASSSSSTTTTTTTSNSNTANSSSSSVLSSSSAMSAPSSATSSSSSSTTSAPSIAPGPTSSTPGVLRCEPLTSGQCKAITDYFSSTFFKHWMLYRATYDPSFQTSTHVVKEKVLIETPIVDGFSLNDAIEVTSSSNSSSNDALVSFSPSFAAGSSSPIPTRPGNNFSSSNASVTAVTRSPSFSPLDASLPTITLTSSPVLSSNPSTTSPLFGQGGVVNIPTVPLTRLPFPSSSSSFASPAAGAGAGAGATDAASSSTTLSASGSSSSSSIAAAVAKEHIDAAVGLVMGKLEASQRQFNAQLAALQLQQLQQQQQQQQQAPAPAPTPAQAQAQAQAQRK